MLIQLQICVQIQSFTEVFPMISLWLVHTCFVDPPYMKVHLQKPEEMIYRFAVHLVTKISEGSASATGLCR